MAYGKRGTALLALVLVVDCILIWWVNQPSTRTFTTAPPATVDPTLATYALIGVGIISILAAIIFKLKPVPACLTR